MGTCCASCASVETSHDSRQLHERMTQDVATRLRPICEHMPQQEFDQLVDEVVRTNIKYMQRRAEDLFAADLAMSEKQPTSEPSEKSAE
jgi:hypothetical protein